MKKLAAYLLILSMLFSFTAFAEGAESEALVERKYVEEMNFLKTIGITDWEVLKNDTRKVEKSREATKKQRNEKTMHADTAFHCRMRFARGHMVLVNMFFAFILVMSIALLGASGVILERSAAEVAAVEEAMEQNEKVETVMLLDGGEDTVSAQYLTLANENTAEIYEKTHEESGFDAFLRVLAYLK